MNMKEMWEQNIRLDLPTISCEGIEFQSIKDAAKYFNLSDERIRQKLKDPNEKNFKTLY
jgi:hypothetical protein